MAKHADYRLNVATTIKKEDLMFKSVLEKPFKVSGVFFEDGKFRRLPESVAQTVSEGVLSLHANTSGGRVRFITNSRYIAITVKYAGVCRMPHFSLCGSAGLDLYVSEVGGASRFFGCFVPPYEMEDYYESRQDLGSNDMREITVNMPLYSDVAELMIGVEAGAELLAPTPYKGKAPIVYYGNSITQGACASRPGNAFAAEASRAVGYDFVNLGFSGRGRGEVEIAEYIAALDMSVYVSDYDHNALNAEFLENTHERMFKIIREKNPTLPIVLMTMTSMSRIVRGEREARRDIIYKTYLNAIDRGDKNVYFIDGSKIFDECGDGATVEGCHPNDLGQAYIAKTLIPVLREIVEKL